MLRRTSTNKLRVECRKKFLRFFPGGFYDPKYIAWERGYKWEAHKAWQEGLNETEYRRLLQAGEYHEIAHRAVKLETRTNLLFSFEKMALRDAVKPEKGAELFAEGLFDYIYGTDSLPERFEKFAAVLERLPRKQTRVRTWPLQTVFAFIAKPKEHIFLKPVVTKTAAELYGYDFIYRSQPNWETYKSLLDFGKLLRKDLIDLKPRDQMDIQSFIWVLGSSEYDE